MKMNTNPFFTRPSMKTSRSRLLGVLFAMLVAMLMPPQAWAADSELETMFIGDKSYYVLRNDADWNVFCRLVAEARGRQDVNAIVDGHFTITSPCGSASAPYNGTFNGNGHSLKVDLSSDADYEAPFIWVKNATFKNLEVFGDVKGKLHAAGLVGAIVDGSSPRPEVTFERVINSVNVVSSSTRVGGYVGHSHDAIITMTDCQFEGTLKANNASDSYGGAFVGWSHSQEWGFHRLYEYGTYSNVKHVGFCYKRDGGAWGYNDDCTLCISNHNWGEVKSEWRNIRWGVEHMMNAGKAGSWQFIYDRPIPFLDVWPTADDAGFETYQMIPGTEEGEEGMLKIPFSCNQPVSWIKYTYTNQNGDRVASAQVPYPKNTYAGFILLSATDQHKDLTLEVKLQVGSISVTVNSSDDAVMHKPQNLATRVLRFTPGSPLTDAGAVELTWNVQDPGYKDVIDGDQFVIMRSLTGSDADMQTIGAVLLESDVTNYTFKDSTLMSALTQGMLSNGGSAEVKYTVVRGAASEMWGLSNNVTAASTSVTLSNLHLMEVVDFTAAWEDETARTINVSWRYDQEAGAVWESHVQMQLLLMTTNRQGAAVDTTAIVLTEDEMTACKKIVTLPRSCVNYKIAFRLAQDSSPMPNKVKYIAITTEDDWSAFCSMVAAAKGQYSIIASLLADLTVTEMAARTADEAFSGTFEGNTHTLTLNISNNAQYTALFGHVKNATVRNLNVTGSVTSGSKFTAGMVASLDVNGSLLIESSRMAATVASSISGDASNGGFVAYVHAGASVTLRNCKFGGTFEGADCHSNGGFVGYMESGSQATVVRSLFAPTAVNTKFDNCQTWARVGGTGKLTVISCYATKEYAPNADNTDKDADIVIESEADWNRFVTMVSNAGGNAVNVALAADITVTKPVGGTYSGIFDGKGHTLTLNLTEKDNVALFSSVGGCTIRNLHVTGSVEATASNGWAAALIYRQSKSSPIIFSNCHVSATVKGSSIGGFIHSPSSSVRNVFTDCLFDGTLKGRVGGAFVAFIAWASGTTLQNCLDKGTYEGAFERKGIVCDDKIGFVPSNSTNVWSYNGFASDASSMPVGALVNTLGSSCWKEENGQAVPILFANDDERMFATLGSSWTKDASGSPVPMMNSSMPTFYYENLGHIDPASLRVQMQATSAVLTWNNADDEPVDYYEVWRYDKQQDKWEPLDTQITDMQYEDTKTSPVHQYIYKVRGVTNCEGLTYDETEEAEGMCVQTASVEGHLRFLDGSGIPNKKIIVTVANGERSALTDESGFFRLSGLPYVDGKETTCSLTVAGIMGIDPQIITFGTAPGENVVKDVVFEVGESVKLSGNVQYNGTSIPVQGVSFMVDGYEVHNAAGKVTTDHEGKFAFRILPGAHDSIQAVKDGHVFWRGGFYHENDNDHDTIKAYTFTDDKAGIMFYDDTRVKLTGRIVGGKTQGEKPLGYALSKNNLGDDLQMVLTLEGDNASRLVWDIQDRNKKERDEVFVHQRARENDGKYRYQTSVHTTINRMVVTPDIHTGEYEVLLPPVKWKIQQITAKGYPTLFQDGQTGDVLDLSDSVTLHRDTIRGSWKTLGDHKELTTVVEEYHAKYSRIYHSPVIIGYRQQGFAPFDHLGDQYYTYKDLTGQRQQLTIAYGVRKEGWPVGKPDSLETRYTFGYPVFSTDKKYPLWISATEKYYYNNNTKSDTIDVVRLEGGVVTIQNGMMGSTHKETLQLDSVGEGCYVLAAAETPYLLTGKDALNTVTMTLLLDGTHYEAKPIRGYVFKVQQPIGAKDIISCSAPQLVDILRDPPGGSSKATLSKGSTLKYSYTMDLKWSAGAAINFGIGSGVNSFTGVVVAPMGAGAVGGVNNGGANYYGTSIDLMWSGTGQRGFTYTMTAKEDISTSSDKTIVGANGDLYMGVVQNIVVKPATAIRAIPDSVFRLMDGPLKAGRTVEIAQGRDNNGKLLHLVRDEVVAYKPAITSDFVHSQHYILNQLIPELTEQILSLLFTGSEAEAHAQANATNEPVYLSLVSKDHPDFGTSYKMIVPDAAPANTPDKLSGYLESMRKWVEMIAQNEKEKLNATDLVKNFDVDGTSSVSYSETFASDYTVAKSFVSPITAGTAGYFEDAGDGASAFGALVGPMVAKILANLLKGKAGKTSAAERLDGDEDGLHVKVDAVGLTFKFNIVPSMSLGVTPKETEAKAYNRTESFSIAMDKRSHLSFNLYRVTTDVDNVKSPDIYDVFYNSNFYDQVDYDIERIKKEIDTKNFKYARSFVYRTVGGATCRPWEGERKTLFHKEGTVLDERTKKIENPVVRMDKQSLSGVPFGEPARFKLYFTNESEQPEIAHPYFNIYQNEKKNPDGAKMMIDGVPLTGNMRTISVLPGEVTEKTLEVYAGEQFDYEGLTVGLISLDDPKTYHEVSFDVHYLQKAGDIAITSPGDKWIMNCDAPQEEGKGWYLPVVIAGFNKNQHNFDHIEFQYKETNRGDDYWTNLCGYYADSTIYRAASGTKEMIPVNGNIITRFFGEGQEMEKGYDLRAVLFCRNGNSFLTSESKVLSGIKDTRRPQLFGTPEPKNGILEAGQNIVFDFSEDIEYNYLQATTNFEVLGETNETSVQEAPSLRFSGAGLASTQAQRNFADKSVTLEVMLRPDEVDADMPIFSHGTEGKALQLWLTKDKYLRAVVENGDGPRSMMSNKPLSSVGFQRVALVLDNTNKQMMLYTDEQVGKMDNITYSGYGPLTFGYAYTINSGEDYFYTGRMLQARLWYRALDLATLNRYGGKLLTGYEMGLAAYYPMNDGRGRYALDKTQGAHLMLEGATWAQPEGMSLKLDANEPRPTGEMKGLQLRTQLFQRDNEQDYTLMFWFKTAQDSGTLIANGSGTADEEGAPDKFFIGFEDHILFYRSNGQEYSLGDDLCDDAWHHYAMTVNRQRNVATIYVDNEVKVQFTTNTLGGMLGTRFYVGNTVWQKNGDPAILEGNALTGYIDGLGLFEQALPSTLIKRYSNKSPGGEEVGLLVYMSFDHQEQQKSGELTLQPYAMSNLVKRDNDGKSTNQRDSVFVKPVDEILTSIDRSVGAPMQAFEQLHKLNFSFVGRSNQLLVNIDEQDRRINKQHVYVTLYEIPDKNGNYMKSPVTESFFVNQCPLEWNDKQIKTLMYAGSKREIYLEIVNNDSKSHTYTIENLPQWMTPDKTTNVIDAQNRETVSISIHKDLNVGVYDYILYLTDENGLSDPCYIELTVEGSEPNWWVDMAQKRYSMNVVAQVYVGNTLVTDSRDIVGVFDQEVGGRCMGVANIKHDPVSERSLLYMTVYDSTTVANRLFFRLWHAATGKTMQLSASEIVNFGEQTIVGTVDKPLQLTADDLYLQKIELLEGWNWISFNVWNQAFENLETILARFPWQEGDILTEDSEDLTMTYRHGKWMSNANNVADQVNLSQEFSYRVKVGQDREVEIWGTAYKSSAQRTITVKPGWNSIGYTPLMNLPVATALSDYFVEASPGDVVKNQHEFAMFVSDGRGGGSWLGTLEYMKPGDGYMIHRLKNDTVRFVYPYYEPGTSFIETGASRASRFHTTMTMVAEPTGIDLMEGDKLVAYANGEQVGEARCLVPSSESRVQRPESIVGGRPLFFLSIEGDARTPLSFAIERGGDIIATTGELMTYESNVISGSPGEPTQISFAKASLPQTGWYTVEGVKLPKAPARSGVYIYNGMKKLIK